jgi:hypothetical protein
VFLVAWCIHSANGNIQNNGAHKNNNENNTTPMFIELNKTTQKTRTPQEKIAQEKTKSYILK